MAADNIAELVVISCGLIISQILLQSIYENSKKKESHNKGPTRKWIKRRREKGFFYSLLEELRLEDPLSYRNWLRMDESMFIRIADKVRQDIIKSRSHMYEHISPEERLAVTLKFLATGTSFKELSYMFHMGERTVSNIITETCDALFRRLGSDFRLPSSSQQWKRIAKEFNDRWNFPHCIGAIDGKHITIKKPANSVSHYHNYKGRESIVMMAVVDADMQFIYVDVGTNGRISDGGVWMKCQFNKMLEANELNLPSPEPIDSITGDMPYVFVADDAFPLKTNIMKPFAERHLDSEKKIFNYRLSRSRRCVESAFGILANRFRVFLTGINLGRKKVQKLILAACSLHNILRDNKSKVYCPQNLIDQESIDTGEIIPGIWREDDRSHSMLPLEHSNMRNPSADAKMTRDKFKNYFISETESVSWQWNL